MTELCGIDEMTCNTIRRSGTHGSPFSNVSLTLKSKNKSDNKFREFRRLEWMVNIPPRKRMRGFYTSEEGEKNITSYIA